MGFSAAKAFLVLSIALCLVVEAQLVDQKSFQQIGENVVWASTLRFYDEVGDEDRRYLYGRGVPIYSYISYGALSANRVPCPPRSGRSYYTHNCFRSREPVNPYTRGCSCITRCRR